MSFVVWANVHPLCMAECTLCGAYCAGLVSEEGSWPAEAKGCILHVSMVRRYVATASQTDYWKICVITMPWCLPALKVHTVQAETIEKCLFISNGYCRSGFQLLVALVEWEIIVAGVTGNFQELLNWRPLCLLYHWRIVQCARDNIK